MLLWIFLSVAGVEPAISRLEVGRGIHFATRTQGTNGSLENGTFS